MAQKDTSEKIRNPITMFLFDIVNASVQWQGSCLVEELKIRLHALLQGRWQDREIERDVAKRWKNGKYPCGLYRL